MREALEISCIYRDLARALIDAKENCKKKIIKMKATRNMNIKRELVWKWKYSTLGINVGSFF